MGYRFAQTRGSWNSHGLPLVMLSTLWLSYYAFYFSFNTIIELLVMDGRHLMTFSLENESEF